MSAQRAIDFGYGTGNPPEVEAAFEATPPEMVAEILDGELHVHPRPARRHSRATTRLVQWLGRFDHDGGEGPGGWVILFEPELHLGPRPDKMAPDIAGWRRERMPDALGPDDAPYYYDLAPDWVCEVVSPRTERVDRTKKMRIYRRERVPYIWLVNPVEQILEVYQLEGERYAVLDTFSDDELVRAAPFEALELPLAELWAK